MSSNDESNTSGTEVQDVVPETNDVNKEVVDETNNDNEVVPEPQTIGGNKQNKSKKQKKSNKKVKSRRARK
jgi:hypothetical protein